MINNYILRSKAKTKEELLALANNHVIDRVINKFKLEFAKIDDRILVCKKPFIVNVTDTQIYVYLEYYKRKFSKAYDINENL